MDEIWRSDGWMDEEERERGRRLRKIKSLESW